MLKGFVEFTDVTGIIPDRWYNIHLSLAIFQAAHNFQASWYRLLEAGQSKLFVAYEMDAIPETTLNMCFQWSSLFNTINISVRIQDDYLPLIE